MSGRVVVSAGTGPWEVRRFVALLAAAAEARCASRGVAILGRETVGPAEAPRSVTLAVGDAATEALGDWVGTHALRAASPRRAKRSRRRWFAAVAVVDEAPVQVEVRREDVVIRTCRAGGPGGQHVNTSSTAVQLVHRPTGVSVRASDERSQAANLRLAFERLRCALEAAHQERERVRASAEHRGRRAVERGSAVRSWRCDAGWTRLIEEEG